MTDFSHLTLIPEYRLDAIKERIKERYTAVEILTFTIVFHIMYQNDQPVSISIEKTDALNASLRLQIEACTKEEFGPIEAIQQYVWSKPTWTVIVKEGAALGSFLHIVERTILLDDKPTLVAGINNVITPPPFRGKGYATDALSEAQDMMFRRLKVQYGLVLCPEAMVPYYEKLGWYKVDCPVYFQQPDNKRHLWKYSAMLLPADGNLVQPSSIDLQGYPW